MNLIDKIKANAIQANKKIVLAEGEEERTLKAADIILDKGYAGIVLLGPSRRMGFEKHRQSRNHRPDGQPEKGILC